MTFKLVPYTAKGHTIYLTEKFYLYLVQNAEIKKKVIPTVGNETFRLPEEFVASELQSPIRVKINIRGKLVYFKNEVDVLEYLTTLKGKNIQDIKLMLDKGATYLQAGLYNQVANKNQQKIYTGFIHNMKEKTNQVEVLGAENKYIQDNFSTLVTIAIQEYRCCNSEPVPSPYIYLRTLSHSLGLVELIRLIKRVKESN